MHRAVQEPRRVDSEMAGRISGTTERAACAWHRKQACLEGLVFWADASVRQVCAGATREAHCMRTGKSRYVTMLGRLSEPSAVWRYQRMAGTSTSSVGTTKVRSAT